MMYIYIINNNEAKTNNIIKYLKYPAITACLDTNSISARISNKPIDILNDRIDFYKPLNG